MFVGGMLPEHSTFCSHGLASGRGGGARLLGEPRLASKGTKLGGGQILIMCLPFSTTIAFTHGELKKLLVPFCRGSSGGGGWS